MATDRDTVVACPGCGAVVPDIEGPTHAYIGAGPGCWAAWGEFQARSFASPAIAAVQPLAVDVYAVQHPGLAERRAIQSVWVHLVSLCLILERGRSPADGSGRSSSCWRGRARSRASSRRRVGMR